jgi:chorismate-pyruvate lyase
MGLGAAEHGNSTVAGRSIVNARTLAQEARAVLQRGDDPIDERDRLRARQRTEATARKMVAG